ncbi:hypothetical protein SLEP1_g24227 [Rubroshorea leprosula]|uniref:RRM domain-containing protein n=1 Tax=Rubroshorea leprosula TaxID=152421 RepID=A0AAV5JL75_9ROSI|nr:hypothetical protein SLEP1_g24227 [Rubroshorea leprosula]
MGGGNNPRQYNDTTLTKIFVGGLAWETQRDTMRRYFEQFGEIIEAVVITDKNTGRSKGYGFVTFKDPEAAMRACQNQSPVIDGRRANCNLASLGANKTRPPTPQHAGGGRFRPAHGLSTAPPYHGSSSSYMHQPTSQYSIPYSAFGYAGYSQDAIYPLNYYGLYGGQQLSPYYASGASGTPGIFHNFYPLYAQHAQSSQGHGFGVQYPQMLQYPYLPQQYGSTGILSLPSSIPMVTTSAGASTTMTATTTIPVTSSSIAAAAATAAATAAIPVTSTAAAAIPVTSTAAAAATTTTTIPVTSTAAAATATTTIPVTLSLSTAAATTATTMTTEVAETGKGASQTSSRTSSEKNSSS